MLQNINIFLPIVFTQYKYAVISTTLWLTHIVDKKIIMMFIDNRSKGEHNGIPLHKNMLNKKCIQFR